MFSAASDAGGFGNGGSQSTEKIAQPFAIVQNAGQKYNPVAKDDGRFTQTTFNDTPRGVQKHPMLHNHANQFRIQYRHLTLRRGDRLQCRHSIVRLPQLEQKFGLPAGAVRAGELALSLDASGGASQIVSGCTLHFAVIDNLFVYERRVRC